MGRSISVIIPAYNSARTLRPCLAAVYAQTRPPDEVFVVDDASTDGTREIAREFPVTLLEQPVNQGPAAARNRGIRDSHGDLLVFVDADCALSADAIENAVKILDETPDVACVHGLYLTEPLFDDGPVEAYRLLHNHYWRLRHVGRVRTAIFAVCAIERAVFDDVGLFDERLRASEDVELSDRMADRYGILLSAAVTCRHDDDSQLWPLLRKQFGRSQLLIPVALHERGPAGVRANRPLGVLAAALAAATLPLSTAATLLLGAVAAPLFALPVAGTVLFALADPGLAAFVRRHRGPAFLAFFLAVHFLVQLAVVTGAVVGGLRYLVRRDLGPSHAVRARAAR
ncbi:glycosyltransferase [Actinomycetes bacterium KLBMP 9797]